MPIVLRPIAHSFAFLFAACFVLGLAAPSAKAQSVGYAADPTPGLMGSSEPSGDAEEDDAELGATRTLAGHTFIPSLIVEFPFVATSFGSASSFGLQTVDLGTDAAGTDLGNVKLAAFEEQFELGVRITDRIGLRANIVGTVGIGADNKSALIAGANFAGQGGLGAVIMILNTETLYLSGHLHGDFGMGSIISPLLFGNEALSTGQLNSDTLRSDLSFWSVNPAVAAAFAPLPYLGLQSSLTLNVSGLKSEGQKAETATALSLGLSASFDAATLFAPIGFLLSYGGEIPFSDGDPVHGIEGGVFYTGLRHLNLGAAIATTLGADESQLYGQLRITHYW